ncbi:MAG: PEPxxWA-CTERM sorting domain-containing protein [Phenylobacterium sp.]|nr:PEPxxWA-CTERM sorting domain-containing protein [Phenylobacterium sp.]
MTSSAVPEPGAWAMMILGFGLAGTAIRTGRQRKMLFLAA